MVEGQGTEGQLGHIAREREGVFDIIVLVDSGWSRFGSAESGDRSNFDCGNSLLIFIFATIRSLNWRTDVNDSRRLLGDTRTGEEAIDNSPDLCSSCLTEVHLDIPVVEIIVLVGCVGDAVYRFVLRKVKVGIRPFLTGLGWGGDSDHVGK